MKQILLAIIMCSSATVFGQYCLTGGPSSLNDSNLESLSFTGTSGGINYIGCPGVLGVEEYFTQTTTLNAGSAYVLTVQFGTCGGNYNGNASVWIDYNQNNLFEASEVLLEWSGIPPMAPANYVVNIPAGASTGVTRMRVMHAESLPLPLDPCASFTWGSVTDFIVEIQGGIDCSGYVGDNINDPIIVPSLPYTDNSSTAVCYTNQNPVHLSPDVYYKVTTDPLNPLMSISLCGSSFDTFLTVEEPNGTVITGNDDGPSCAPQSEITFSTANYTEVYVVVEGWGIQSGDYTLNINEQPLGLDDMSLEGIAIYPNPTNSAFNLQNEMDGQVEIMDMSGSIVLKMDIEPNQTISVNELINGFYLVRFSSGNHSTIEKLIKK